MDINSLHDNWQLAKVLEDMSKTDFPLMPMTLNDDFEAYEHLAASNMKTEDYYRADELKTHIASGYVSAWWIKPNDQAPIAWCGMNNTNKDWPNSCNFLGVVVDKQYRNSGLALRLIRHIFRQAGHRPITTYIQPGVKTEMLLKPFGFKEVGVKECWKLYVCENNPFAEDQSLS